MRRYLKFAASFWMSAFLMTVAQTKSTAKAKKRGSSTATPVPTAMVGQDKHTIPLPQI
jgi:hypothetical protein